MTKKEYLHQYYLNNKASSKINGAYPKDIEDAIKTIEYYREWQELVFEAEPNIDLTIAFMQEKRIKDYAR